MHKNDLKHMFLLLIGLIQWALHGSMFKYSSWLILAPLTPCQNICLRCSDFSISQILTDLNRSELVPFQCMFAIIKGRSNIRNYGSYGHCPNNFPQPIWAFFPPYFWEYKLVIMIHDPFQDFHGNDNGPLFGQWPMNFLYESVPQDSFDYSLNSGQWLWKERCFGWRNPKGGGSKGPPTAANTAAAPKFATTPTFQAGLPNQPSRTKLCQEN